MKDLEGRSAPDAYGARGGADVAGIHRASGRLPSGPLFRLWVMPRAVVLDVEGTALQVQARRMSPPEAAQLAAALNEASTGAPR